MLSFARPLTTTQFLTPIQPSTKTPYFWFPSMPSIMIPTSIPIQRYSSPSASNRLSFNRDRAALSFPSVRVRVTALDYALAWCRHASDWLLCYRTLNLKWAKKRRYHWNLWHRLQYLRLRADCLWSLGKLISKINAQMEFNILWALCIWLARHEIR